MHKASRNAIYIIATIIIAINIVLVPTKGKEELDVKVPILLYHNIIQNVDGENLLVSISPDNFWAHITALKNAGFEGITFDDYYDFINNGKNLPKNPIIITFDDGYLSNYEYAFPTLKELNMKATIFIITSTVGMTKDVSYPHFTWNQAKEMEESGIIDIESHSHSHMEMPSLDKNTMVRELRLSKYLIETNLDKECNFFAYPYGMYNEQSLKLASEAGYKMQSKLGNTGYNTKDTPPTMLKRITVQGNQSAQELISFINNQLNEPTE